ncbi:hypothetical protein HPB50_027513 [Hyalomma asiaticum]|uniref:Uncharacterized protein n=1 Tax=Hyalomma asiaticum TaxID=266040 RepID=A0ACB7T4M8_HYAAI|nr:hypothetical protein HPB50_027513 [Hyalomma asiaticum]
MSTEQQAADAPATTSTVAADPDETRGGDSAADETANSSSGAAPDPDSIDSSSGAAPDPDSIDSSSGATPDPDSTDSSDDAASDYEFDIYDDTDDETVSSTKAKPYNINLDYDRSTTSATNPDTKTAAIPSGANLHKYEEASPQCRLRVKHDIMELFNDPPPGVHIAPVEHNVTVIHALVLGPADTPYEGGFFHFLTAGSVSFNPNLYACGRVCLSILGTWTGPAWSPAQSLSSVLISIQSLLTEKPYFNEPGLTMEIQQGDSESYNSVVQHETIRVAVCDAVEACLKGSSQCPAPLRAVMLKYFQDYYEKYEKVVQSNIALTGRPMIDPFDGSRGTYEYEKLLRRLRTLKGQVE